MRLTLLATLLVAAAFVTGCKPGGSSPAEEGKTGSASETKGTPTELTPDNTKIVFVGTHTEEGKPDPRTGEFKKFSGTAYVDGSKLTSLDVDIETESLTTEIDKLTGHLKSADFFDVKTHPKATFKTTKIEPAGDGTVNVTGELTLLGVTKPVTFPATVSTDGGLKLNAEFTIDWTDFGMDFGTENVEEEVALKVSIGG